MKKLLFIAAIMAISMSSFAQVKYGVKAGVNFANGTGDDFENGDMRTSLQAGAFARFSLSETFAFQPELLYSGQGSKYSESETGYSYDQTLKLNYLNIPLMFKYYASNGFNIQAGPQLGFLMSAKMKEEETADGTTISVEEDIKDQVKGFDFGLDFGLGYDLESGLGFDLRYGLGLTNIVDNDDADGKNSVISLAVSYAF
nr:porin family protein [uncultured Carboxylicivirga sp.]